MKWSKKRNSVVDWTITKWEMEVPISSQDPWFVTLKNIWSPMPWQKSKRIPKFLSTWVVEGRSARQKQDTSRKGPMILVNIRTIITQGLNTLTKHLVLDGSKELKLPMFPVPKNDKKTKNNCKKKSNPSSHDPHLTCISPSSYNTTQSDKRVC